MVIAPAMVPLEDCCWAMIAPYSDQTQHRISRQKNRRIVLFLPEACPTLAALFMTVRREIARKRVPREAYLVSRMRRYRHTLSVLRFTRKSRESAIAAAALRDNAG
jgi:hypothetical protein